MTPPLIDRYAMRDLDLRKWAVETVLANDKWFTPSAVALRADALLKYVRDGVVPPDTQHWKQTVAVYPPAESADDA